MTIRSFLRRRLLKLTPDEINRDRIARLRRRGVRIGRDCQILTEEFSTEPFLVEIGDRVIVAGGVQFLTHDGSAARLRARHPRVQILGPIRVGSDTYIGQSAIILFGVTIGARCVIGAGSVVRDDVPDGSVVMGNPAKVVLSTEMFEALSLASKNRFDSFGLPPAEVERMIRERFQNG